MKTKRILLFILALLPMMAHADYSRFTVMKRVFLSFVISFFSVIGLEAHITVYLQSYSVGGSNGTSNETFSFRVENSYPNPIYVTYILVKDLRQNTILYYSNDQLIINSPNGFATAWPQEYHFSFSRYSTIGSNLWNTTYMVEISYVEVYDGAQMRTDQFFTNGSINVPLISTAIKAINTDAEPKKYYDLNGNVVKKPIKGKIYICDKKKIIY